MPQRPITARFVRRDEGDRSFDRAFWQQHGHEAIFAAAWEMIAEVDLMRGRDVCQSRLQRSVQHLERRER
jgi:hypothetical protein